jgi:predicted permease
MGRLKPGIDETQASARMTLLYQQAIPEQFASWLPQRDMQRMLRMRVNLMPGSKGLSDLRRRFSRPLFILMGVVGLVLLTACANVANLLLAKAAFRRRETGVRLALGAGRLRLVRQLLTESTLLSAMGGVLGWLFAREGVAMLLGLVSNGASTVALNVQPDARVLSFTIATCLLTGILFGLAPALQAARANISPDLRESRTQSAMGSSLGKALVVSQVVLSLLVLIGAGLFVRSLQNLNAVDVGYNRQNLLLVSIAPTGAGYSGTGVSLLSRRLLDKLAAIPGVNSVSLSLNGLFTGGDNRTGFRPEGQKASESTANVDWVGPNYFSTVGIPILLGRDIGMQDNNSSRKVAFVNEAFARYAFPGINPVGRRFSSGNPKHATEFEIAGVTRDVKDHQLQEEPPRRFYVPFFQADPDMFKHSRIRFELRSSASLASIAADARRAVQEIDKNLPILEISPLTVLIDRSLAPERLIATIIGLFSLLALALASLGLYGIMAYAVARRTNEIGIRMALGAEPGRVLWLVLREALQLVVLGLAIGIPLALAMSRVVRGILFGLSPNDPSTIAFAAALMMTVALLAAYVPARRAARTDPMEALRCE